MQEKLKYVHGSIASIYVILVVPLLIWFFASEHSVLSGVLLIFVVGLYVATMMTIVYGVIKTS